MLCYSVSTRFLMREIWEGQNERRCDAGSRRSEVRCDVSRGPQVRRKEARLAYRQRKGPQAKKCRKPLEARNTFSPRASSRDKPCPHLDFSPVKLTLAF